MLKCEKDIWMKKEYTRNINFFYTQKVKLYLKNYSY